MDTTRLSRHLEGPGPRRIMRVSLIANIVVALEGVAVAFSIVIWGLPAMVIGLPVLFASIMATLVLWMTVVPQRLMRDAAQGRPGAQHGRADRTGSRHDADAGWSAMEPSGGPYGSLWSPGSGTDGERCGPSHSAEPASGSWSSCDGPSWSDGTSPSSWSDNTSSSSSSSSWSDSSSSSFSSDSSSSSSG